jgi:hypothetical protein
VSKADAIMNRVFCVLLLLGLPATPAFAGQDAEQAKIAYLIDSIAALHDGHFIRNGVEYDSAQAADHLRLKLRAAGSRVHTAAQFIVRCATGSSMSGQPYTIRFADGKVVEAAAFLRARLAMYVAEPHPG